MTKTCRRAAFALLVLALPSAALAQATRSAEAPYFLDFPGTLDMTAWLQAANAVCASGPAANSNYVFTWDGHCRDGRMDGPGALTHRRSLETVTFEGSFSNGVAEGHALVLFPRGRRVDGEFHAGRLEGPGVVIDEAGIKSEGIYKDGVLAGKFSTTMPDGSRLEGIYVDGKLDGPSVWRSPRGARIETSYHADVETGRRVTTFADGSRFVLDVIDDVEATRAVYIDGAGHRIAGRYRHAEDLREAHASPPYPPLSRRLNEHGVALVSFLITDDGYVVDAALRRSSGSWRLDNAALFGVTRWRYRPAMVGRHRVAEIRTVPVPFTFEQQDPPEYIDHVFPVTP